MSPYPSQVSRDSIIERARKLIEADGIENLSMSRLADVLGIKAPSLYRHVNNKTELLLAINTLTIQELVSAAQSPAVEGMDSPMQELLAMARNYRHYAHTHPISYELAFAPAIPEIRVSETLAEALVIPIQNKMAELSGVEKSLTALRGLLALMHGFVMLELNTQFRRGGDLSATFEQVIEAYLKGWEGEQTDR